MADKIGTNNSELLVGTDSDDYIDGQFGSDVLIGGRGNDVYVTGRYGTVALDADDRILYDAASGAILFDPDGSGSTNPILFAAVTSGTGLSATDFLII